jgi:quercetin dioxygenase-like cupin family protein
MIDRQKYLSNNQVMPSGADPAGVFAVKSLADRNSGPRFVEDYVFPWPEVADPPFGAMVCCVSPGAQTEPDQHNQDEIAFVYRGFGHVTVDGAVRQIRQGDIVFLPRAVEHTFTNLDATGDLAFFSVWWPRIEPEAAS